MDYTAAKVANIALGAISLGLASYNIKDALYYHRMDEIFVGIVSLCILEAMISLLLSCCCKNRAWSLLDQIVRGIISFVLCFIGGGLIYSAIGIENDDELFCNNKYPFTECQHYEVKIAAGGIAIVNGIIYASTKKIQRPPKPVVYAPATMAVTPVVPFMVVQGQEMQYMPQQDYRIPRFQAHQNYSSNYTSGQPIQYPRRNNPLQQNTSPYQYQYNYNPNHQQNFNSSQQQYYH